MTAKTNEGLAHSEVVDIVEDYLLHYGVKGMKWGRRRSSSSSSSSGSRSKTKEERPVSEDSATANALKKKRVSEMSNAELKKLNERMQLEANYAQLMGKQKGSSSKVAQGQKFVKGALGTAQTINQVYSTMNTPAFKEARRLLNI